MENLPNKRARRIKETGPFKAFLEYGDSPKAPVAFYSIFLWQLVSPPVRTFAVTVFSTGLREGCSVVAPVVWKWCKVPSGLAVRKVPGAMFQSGLGIFITLCTMVLLLSPSTAFHSWVMFMRAFDSGGGGRGKISHQAGESENHCPILSPKEVRHDYRTKAVKVTCHQSTSLLKQRHPHAPQIQRESPSSFVLIKSLPFFWSLLHPLGSSTHKTSVCLP